MNIRSSMSLLGYHGTAKWVMGATCTEAVVIGPTGKQAEVRFLVDSGATYTLFPEKVWKVIELTPKRRSTFTLADGTTIQRDVSESFIRLPQGEGHTPVILGEPGDEAVLGVATLEILGLILNSFTRELQPIRMLLVRCSGDFELLQSEEVIWYAGEIPPFVRTQMAQGRSC